jgi:hypothetical protein
MPLNEEEKELYNFDKNIIHRFNSQLDKGSFYLGGEIKMTHNDIINLDSISKVRDIITQRVRENKSRYSWDLASIYTYQKELEIIERMINTFDFIMNLREKK